MTLDITIDMAENQEENSRWECRREECEKDFAHQSTMIAHMKKCNKGEVMRPEKQVLTCPHVFCKQKNKVFSSAYNLKRHITICKPKVQPVQHICMEPYCGRRFEKACLLARHVATHSKLTYVCERCWTEYERPDKFASHQERCNVAAANLASVDPNLPSMAMDNSVSNGQESGSAAVPTVDADAVDSGSSSMAINDVVGESQSSSSVAALPHNNDPVDSTSSLIEVDILDSQRCSEAFAAGHYAYVQPELDSTFGMHQDDFTSTFDYDQAAYSSIDPNTTSVSDIFDSMTLNAAACNEDDSIPPQVYILDEPSTTTPPEPSNNTNETPIDFEGEIANSTITYLKLLKHQARRSSVKLQEFAKMCILLFASKFEDVDFMEMLADELNFESKSAFLQYVNLDRIELTERGRPMSHVATRQIMYDFWKKHSELSNDRRNARHVIKMKPTKRDVAVVDLVDPQITEVKTKGGFKLKAQKYIYTLTTREMFSMFKMENPNVQCSPTLFYRCKPFYISPPTLREMEGCLCQKCHNPHSIYNTIRRHVKDLPVSLSEYLTTSFTCQKDTELNFFDLDCIHGCCKNGCEIINDLEREDIDWEKKVSYYEFEMVNESYNNKQGEKRFYKRIARVDYKDVKLRDVYARLMELSKDYLVHRHMTIVDKVYWARFLCNVDQPVLWMDYSMNIKLTEKNQVQSAHFSGKQQTLHDSLIQDEDGNFNYIYHLSNDTNHDSVMTIKIIEDIILAHPEVIRKGRLILRSDNCSTQYKCKFVFKALLLLAIKYNIRIDWLFGEAGHGRGLIDAMAWFGCKAPLRTQILTKNQWFKDAKEMYDFLKLHFKDDIRKEYFSIDEDETAEMRKKERESRPCPGCRASHVMSFFPDGESVKMWKTIKDFMNDVEMEEGEDVEMEEEVQLDWIESIDSMDRFKLIDVGSFVAIKATAAHPESFHLMKVLDKQIATDRISDSSKEHCILKWEPYLVAKWYSFCHEGKKSAIYSESSDDVEDALIHIGEIFSTDIEVKEKQINNKIQFHIDIADYKMLLCCCVN